MTRNVLGLALGVGVAIVSGGWLAVDAWSNPGLTARELFALHPVASVACNVALAAACWLVCRKE